MLYFVLNNMKIFSNTAIQYNSKLFLQPVLHCLNAN